MNQLSIPHSLIQRFTEREGSVYGIHLQQALDEGMSPWAMAGDKPLLLLLLEKGDFSAVLTWLEKVGDLSRSPWPISHPHPMEVALDCCVDNGQRDLAIQALIEQGVHLDALYRPSESGVSFFHRLARTGSRQYFSSSSWILALMAAQQCPLLHEDLVPLGPDFSLPLHEAIWRTDAATIETYIGICREQGRDYSWQNSPTGAFGVLNLLGEFGWQTTKELGFDLERPDLDRKSLLHWAVQVKENGRGAWRLPARAALECLTNAPDMAQSVDGSGRTPIDYFLHWKRGEKPFTSASLIELDQQLCAQFQRRKLEEAVRPAPFLKKRL